MILTDTTIVIEFLRSGDANTQQIIVSHDAAICGITRAEVLHGIRDNSERIRSIQALDLFHQLGMPDSIWDQVGDNLAALRAAGLAMPLADVIIATVAIANDIELWTRDTHFSLMQPVLSALKLFQEPP